MGKSDARLRTIDFGVCLSLTFAAASAAVVLTALPAPADTDLGVNRGPPTEMADTEGLVAYSSAAGYVVRVPEGWVRSGSGTDVEFAHGQDGVAVIVTGATLAPTLAWTQRFYLPSLIWSGREVHVDAVAEVDWAAGLAIRIRYSSDPEPGQPTSGHGRLNHVRYLYFHNGRMAALDLSSAPGADFRHQWQLIARSFRWR